MDLYAILEELEIEYEEIEHPPVYTVEEARSVQGKIEGIGCKNLLLTNKKKEKFFLVILEENKKADIKAISVLVGVPHLFFANSENLYETLGLIPGSVSPLGIINDKEKRVSLLIDEELKGKRLLFHPNTNTKTLSLSYEDLIRFVECEGQEYRLLQQR